VHPHDAANVSEGFIDNLRQLASHDKVKAIGECGLDFNRNFSPQDKQIEVFKQQLELASELEMPVFLHERDAFEQQIKILDCFHGLTGVAHCFTGTVEQMHIYLEMGLYIGVTGWLCDPKRGASLREAVLELPLERLLIETDAPFLTPKGLKTKEGDKVRRNEPCYLPHIVEAIAEIKGIVASDIAKASTDNARSLFKI
jgi:TatD DNase family protein